MSRVRKFVLPIFVVAAAVASLAFAVGASATGDPTVSVSSHSVAQSGSLTVSGSGCLGHDGEPTIVAVDLVNAWGDPGEQHTQDVASGIAIPDANGDWSITLQVLATAQSGWYDLLVTCMAGETTAESTFLFNYSPECIYVGEIVTSSPVKTKTAETTPETWTSSASQSNSSSSTATTSSSTSTSSTTTKTTSASQSTTTSAPPPSGEVDATDETTTSAAAGGGGIDNSSGLAFTGSSDAGFAQIGVTLLLAGVAVMLLAGLLVYRRRTGRHAA